jgi:nucleoside-diphosphate-sugar epimerase
MAELGKTALLGAAGAVGHALAPQLQAQGVPVRVVGRHLDVLEREFPTAERRRADFLSGEGLLEALAGVDTAFYLAGAPYTHFEQHPVMTRNALTAAQSAGVTRFIHIAPVYSYGPPRTRPVPETHPREPSTRKGRWRLQQEQLVEEAHGKGGLATTITHLPDFYGPHADASFVNVFLRDAVAGKTATFVGDPDAPREFIYVPDSAAPLIAIAKHDDAYGERWNVAGTATTAHEVVQIASELLGGIKYRFAPKWMLQLLGLFNPFMREVAEMYYLYDSGFILDDTKLHERIGDFSKTPLRDGIATTITWIRANPVASGTAA